MAEYRTHLMLCAGTGCVSNKALEVKNALQEEILKQNLQDEVDVVSTGCQGFCAQGPIVVVKPDNIFYQLLDVKDVPFVGDSLRDMQAAAAAGCSPHLVLTGNSLVLRGASLPPTFPAGTQVHTDLNAFVDALLKKTLEHTL